MRFFHAAAHAGVSILDLAAALHRILYDLESLAASGQFHGKHGTHYRFTLRSSLITRYKA